MLTPSQIFSIEALPQEGGCFYYKNGEKIAYDEVSAIQIAFRYLKGKKAPAEKESVILHGAPGSGKSYLGLEGIKARHGDDLPHTAVISYDEEGAIYHIPEYVNALRKIIPEFVDQHTQLSPERALETMEARHKLWLEFQPLSQYIRSLTLKEAMRRELSLFIDTTSSSAGAFKMIETLRDLDYSHIEVWSTFGPLDLAKDRIVQRARPTSGNDYLAKRVGAYTTLPHLCGEADRMVISVNDSNDRAPQKILVLEAGRAAHVNAPALQDLRNRLVEESADFANLANTHLQEVPGLAVRYDAAVENLNGYLLRHAPDSARRSVPVITGRAP